MKYDNLAIFNNRNKESITFTTDHSVKSTGFTFKLSYKGYISL